MTLPVPARAHLKPRIAHGENGMIVTSANRAESADDGPLLARRHVEEAINAEVALLKGAASESVRLAAAEAILNRACGRPPSAPSPVNQQDDFAAVLAAADILARRRSPAGGASRVAVPPAAVRN
jgi:hypothetical protein